MGEILLRVGQRYIAWDAFERASRLADRFYPEESIRKGLREHCRKRQAEIESTLRDEKAWQKVSPSPGAQALANLRADFDRELAVGETFQKNYQKYEQEKIQAGISIDGETFFDQFHARNPSIASPTGSEEWFAWIPPEKKAAYGHERGEVFGIFGAGVAASLAASCFWLARWFRSPLEPSVTEV
jgi:hypothetical protein